MLQALSAMRRDRRGGSALPQTSRRGASLAVLAMLVALLAVSSRARAEEGTVITFTSGTGDSGGSVTVTSATSGSTTTSGLGPQLSPTVCANALALAAPKVGFKAEQSGSSVRIFGRGALVKVVVATVTKSNFADPKPDAGH
jgi:hypothetical protein